MKRVILISLLITLSLAGFAKKKNISGVSAYTLYGKGAITQENGKVAFSMVEKMEGKSATEIFELASAMVQNKFPNSRKYATIITPESQTITISGKELKVDNIYTDSKAHIFYKLILEFKDGKYKVTMTDCLYEYNQNGVIDRTPAEKITDFNSLSGKGKCNNTTYGYQRRYLIDLKEELFYIIKNEMIDAVSAVSAVSQQQAVPEQPKKVDW